MLQMPCSGADCVVLSKHCTGGGQSTDRDSSNNDDDDSNWELLEESNERRELIEQELVFGLCNHVLHLRRLAKVWIVYRVYHKRRAGDLWLCWQGFRQGHQMWRRAVEASAARIPQESGGCCEKSLLYWRRTQLAVTIAAYGSGDADCARQQLLKQDIGHSANRQCWKSKSRLSNSCERGTPDWRVILAGCDVCSREISCERIIVSEEQQARLSTSEELWNSCRHR